MLASIFIPVLVPVVPGKPADFKLFCDLPEFDSDYRFEAGTWALVFEGINAQVNIGWTDTMVWDDEMEWDE